MRKNAVAVAVASAFAAFAIEPAFAASALDTGMQTSVTSGLTSVVDTLKDLLTIGLGLVITGAIIKMVPGLVMGLLKKVGGR